MTIQCSDMYFTINPSEYIDTRVRRVQYATLKAAGLTGKYATRPEAEAALAKAKETRSFDFDPRISETFSVCF